LVVLNMSCLLIVHRRLLIGPRASVVAIVASPFSASVWRRVETAPDVRDYSRSPLPPGFRNGSGAALRAVAREKPGDGLSVPQCRGCRRAGFALRLKFRSADGRSRKDQLRR
jgi:hypothetical protein